MAPETGLEPVTRRLTAGCSTIELLWNSEDGYSIRAACDRQIEIRLSTGWRAQLSQASCRITESRPSDPQRGTSRPRPEATTSLLQSASVVPACDAPLSLSLPQQNRFLTGKHIRAETALAVFEVIEVGV